ncbi:MAG: lactate utilization protein [Clostridiales bacterium]|nr:lactate utilization protein [Candidatus Crickella equi]
MADINKTIKSLEYNGYTVKRFDSAEAAAEWLDEVIDGAVVGFGDSKTIIKMELYRRLHSHNKCYDPNQSRGNEDVFHELGRRAMVCDVFLTSVNAMSETGEMVNIDGTGNRVAGSLFGHKVIYFIVGTNKIEPSLDAARERARNYAGPMNALKYDLPTPCVAHYKQTGEYKCFDCNCPERICNAEVIYRKRMSYLDDAIVVLIDEELGF